jgi:hypothetical protein
MKSEEEGVNDVPPEASMRLDPITLCRNVEVCYTDAGSLVERGMK